MQHRGVRACVPRPLGRDTGQDHTLTVGSARWGAAVWVTTCEALSSVRSKSVYVTSKAEAGLQASDSRCEEKQPTVRIRAVVLDFISGI